MKKIISLYISALFIISCASTDDGGGDTAPKNGGSTSKENSAPSKVSKLIFPANNQLCSTSTLKFEWEKASDPDGDAIEYLIEVAKDNQFSTISASETVSATSKSISLDKGIAYYWRVKSMDSKGLEGEYSSVSQFITEGEGVTNHLPFAAKVVAPELDATISTASINLKWSATDVDNDTLSYDVFLGTVNPPTTKVGSNQTANTLLVSTLETNKTYYWYVVAKDGNGGESIGQIWNFKTN